MKLEDKLAEYLKQPGAFLTFDERLFIEHMRRAAETGVGYGWMQQVIEWEWQSKSEYALGPEYYEQRVSEIRAETTSEPQNYDSGNGAGTI